MYLLRNSRVNVAHINMDYKYIYHKCKDSWVTYATNVSSLYKKRRNEMQVIFI